MARVLIAVPEAIRQELRGTVLFGSSQCLFADGEDVAFKMALASPPNLVLVDGAHATGVALIRRLRENFRTRNCSVVAVSRSSSRSEEQGLRAAGANFVLSLPVDPVRCNARLDQLLSVPPRRQARFSVRYESWTGAVAVAEPSQGVALNISIHGLLLETDAHLDVGARLDLGFALPDRPGELRALGHVTREAESEGVPQSGVEFLILREDASARIEAFVSRR